MGLGAPARAKGVPVRSLPQMLRDTGGALVRDRVSSDKTWLGLERCGGSPEFGFPWPGAFAISAPLPSTVLPTCCCFVSFLQLH